MPDAIQQAHALDDIYRTLQSQPVSEQKVDDLNDLSGKARKHHQSRLGLLITKQALLQSDELHYTVGKVNALLNLALFHYYAEDFESALVNNLQALEAAETTGSEILVERCLNNVGSVYDASGDAKKARAYYERAMEISRRLNRLDKLAITTNNVGSICMAEGQLDQALEYFHESLRLFSDTGLTSNLGYCYCNVGEIYYHRNELDTAIEWMKKGIEHAHEHNNDKVLKAALQLMGKTYMKAGDLDKAEKVMLQVLEMSEDRSIKYSIGAACEQLATLYEAKGDYKKAFEYFDRFVLLQLVIYEEKSRLRMTEMRNLYELEMKELELDMQRFRSEELRRSKREIEQTYRQLQLAEKNLLEMEKQNTELDMSVTANHEINQPLMIINGNLDLLDLEIEQPSDELNDLLLRMHDEVDAIRDILRGIRHSASHSLEKDDYASH